MRHQKCEPSRQFLKVNKQMNGENYQRGPCKCNKQTGYVLCRVLPKVTAVSIVSALDQLFILNSTRISVKWQRHLILLAT